MQQRLQARARGRRRVDDELRLSPVALQGHHRQPGRLRRGGRPVVAPHHVQAQVQPGRGAGRGQDLPVVHEQHAGIDGDAGAAGRQHSCRRSEAENLSLRFL